MLSCSLESPDGFASVQALFANVYVKILLWGVLAALLFHLLAGLRHLVMDLGWCEKLSTAKLTATIVFVLFAIGVVVMGVSLWA
jgi:succinate dehydrogenase / fumarate reductase cytochrome b subunit